MTPETREKVEKLIERAIDELDRLRPGSVNKCGCAACLNHLQLVSDLRELIQPTEPSDE